MNFNFRFYWSLFLRRLPVMLALVIVCSVVGVNLALNLPPTYETSARLLVEAPQIPDNMAASTVQTDAAEQLQVIEQQLLTRANLIDIANKFRVFEDMAAMTPDAVVDEMKRATSIQRSSGREQATLMTLSFTARDGKIAADVINEYVTSILQSANAFRMSRAENTLEFFDQEVARLATDLDQQSSKIVEFKNANSNSLPDDLEYRQGRQALLQERLGRLERERSSVVNQRSEIVRIFEETGRIRPPQQAQLSPEEQRLNELRREMMNARAVLSDSNPRIQLLQTRIDQLEAQIAEDTTAAAPEESPQASLLDITLSELDTRLEALEEEITVTSEELERLETSITATASNAITLNALERDYGNIQNRYNGAVNNLNQSRMGERIEVTSQGQRIRVIEGANVPQDPSGPDRPKIAAAGIGAGLGLAAGYFFLLELLNRRIRRPAELISRFNLTPIATIPYMESRRQKFLRRASQATALLAVLIGVPALLWYVDTSYMPLELIADKIINSLGLS